VDRKQPADAKKPWERLSVLVAAPVALVSLFVAVTQQRPASTLAVCAAVLLLGGWYVVRVVTAKFRSGRPRYPRGRWVAIGVTALVLAGVGVAMAVPGSRTVIAHDVLGFPSVPQDVKVDRVLVSESDADYRIAIVVLNQLSREELVRTVKLSSTCVIPVDGSPPRPLSPVILYQIREEFRVDVSFGDAISGDVIDNEQQGYRAPVVGTMSVGGDCGTLVSLAFGTSAALPSGLHVTIVVDLPKQLTVPDNRPIPMLGSSVPGTKPVAIVRPSRYNFRVTLGLTGAEISGAPD